MALGSKVVSHKAEMSLSLYTGEGEAIEINDEYLGNYASDYNFQNRYMPIFYITMDLPTEIYDKFIEAQSDGHVYLNIRNYNGRESNSIHTNVVSGQFLYFLATQYNKSNEMAYDNTVQKMRYKHLVIGLLDENIIKQFKTPFNAVYPETSTEEMIENILEKVTSELVMDPIEENTDYPTFTMPPQDSVANAIDYLFRQEPFYATSYQFFMDIGKTYLLNSSGQTREGSSMPVVLIQPTEISGAEYYYEGCGRDGESGSYVIYVNANTDIKFHIDTSREKNTNTIVGIYTGQLAKVGVDTVAQASTPARAQFEDETGINLTSIKQQILQNTIVSMTITKKNMDSSKITPDKCYLLNSEDYSQYNGKYLLVSKSEVLSPTGFDWNTTTTLTFKRIAQQE